jgi:hypothetical protein
MSIGHGGTGRTVTSPRSDGEAAAARSAELEASVGGAPRTWGDLFAVDLPLSDPHQAAARLDAGVPREASTSAAVTRLMVELLAHHGAPQPAVTAEGPFGLAFGSEAGPTLIGANPTAQPITVTFRPADGDVLAEIEVQSGGTVTQE